MHDIQSLSLITATAKMREPIKTLKDAKLHTLSKTDGMRSGDRLLVSGTREGKAMLARVDGTERPP